MNKLIGFFEFIAGFLFVVLLALSSLPARFGMSNLCLSITKSMLRLDGNASTVIPSPITNRLLVYLKHKNALNVTKARCQSIPTTKR